VLRNPLATAAGASATSRTSLSRSARARARSRWTASSWVRVGDSWRSAKWRTPTSSISIPTDARARTRIELGGRPGNLMSEPRAPSEHPRPASSTRRMRTSLDGAGTSLTGTTARIGLTASMPRAPDRTTPAHARPSAALFPRPSSPRTLPDQQNPARRTAELALTMGPLVAERPPGSERSNPAGSVDQRR